MDKGSSEQICIPIKINFLRNSTEGQDQNGKSPSIDHRHQIVKITIDGKTLHTRDRKRQSYW